MADTPDPVTAQAAPPPVPSLFDALQDLLRELPGLLSDRVELLSLELQRAGFALARIVALVLAAAVLAAAAWLAFWVVVVGVLVQMLGLPWLSALLLVVLFNVGAAWLALTRARRLVCLLSLPATQRHLMLPPSGPQRPEVPAEPRAADGHAPA